MKNHKILIVDDTVTNLATMVSIIENYFPYCYIYQADGAQSTIDILNNVVPDIILIDWEMPGINGIELMNKIHSKPATYNTPCIIVTGIQITSQNLKTALDAGAIDYIRKPIEVTEFLARINSAIVIAENHKQLIIEKETKIVENIAFASEINHFLKSIQLKANNLEKQITSCSSPTCKQQIDELKADISKKIKSKGWQKYSQLYQKLYPVFTKRLIALHPKLTSTEIELCQMVRIGLSNKEIAELMFVTIGSLNVNKSRLRKKLSLNAYQNIQAYLVGL